jgi:predicted nucleotidyltransferase component of viral defense system
MNELLAILQKTAHTQQVDFQYLLKLYGLERLVYRLASLSHIQNTLVRGSLITRAWAFPKHFRAVQDLDFVVTEPFDEKKGRQIMDEILSLDFNDGFKSLETYQVSKIWEETDLPALRFEIPVQICEQNFQIQIDMAFNDPIIPPAIYWDYPDVLGNKIRIHTITPELACAWKVHGLFEFWNKGNRWQAKTLYDIFLLLDTQTLDTLLLKQALKIAFEDRKTPLSVYQRVLEGQFGQSSGARRAWAKWLESNEGRIVIPDFQPLIQLLREKFDAIFMELS